MAEQHGRRGRIEVAAGHCIEFELAGQTDDVVVSGIHRLSAELTELTGRQNPVHAPQPATNPFPGLQHHDVVTALAAPPCRDQTR